AFSTGMSAGSTLYFTNNTIAGNTNTSAGNMITAFGGGSAGGFVSNNISYANVNGYDYYLYSYQTFEFHNNDFHTLNGAAALGSSGNVDVDPQFAGPGTYPLPGPSPLLHAGLITPAGGMPATDLDGYAFPAHGKLDMGTYEETIFADGVD